MVVSRPWIEQPFPRTYPARRCRSCCADRDPCVATVPNGRGERLQRADASQRPARLRGSAAPPPTGALSGASRLVPERGSFETGRSEELLDPGAAAKPEPDGAIGRLRRKVKTQEWA